MAIIEIRNQDTSTFVCAEEGSNLLQVLRQNGIALFAACGGNGTCGKCKVKVKKQDQRTFEEVLSCRTEVSDQMIVLLEESVSVIPASPESGSSFQKVLSAADPDAYGIAVDLGTTTITASLVDLREGFVLASLTEWNCQIPYGGDVISRIHYMMQTEGGLTELSQMVRSQVNEMIHRLPVTDLSAKTLIAGNTIMQHIYEGIDPSPMAASPYLPKTYFEKMHSYMPCISGFIGGDITSGLYDQGFDTKEGLSLFLDIGTNGEMVIGNKEGLLAVSVATGPAFEGAQITCGCYGRAGALSHIEWDPYLQKFHMEVIDGDLASLNGICGSGLIDLLSVLLSLGILTEEGRILTPEELEDVLDEDTISAIEHQLGMDFLEKDEDGNGIFYLNKTNQVYLATSDVRNLQLAKASVRAGTELLMKKCNKKPEDISEVILAGGFGSHLNPVNLAKIGMLPDTLTKKVSFAGNTSLSGAVRALTDPGAKEKLLHIKNLCRYMELASTEEFADTFIKYLSFQE